MANRLSEVMLHDIFLAIWFFLPAGAANVAPIFAAKVPFLKRFSAPLDGRRMFRDQRLLGDHKTWRGLVVGIVAAALVLWIQQLDVTRSVWLASATSEIDYAHLNVVLIGPLFALGALGGDAVKSFFKRQSGIKPGISWLPFDQLDYILGAALITLPFAILPLAVYIWAVVLWLLIHLVSAFIGYHLGLKEQPL